MWLWKIMKKYIVDLKDRRKIAFWSVAICSVATLCFFDTNIISLSIAIIYFWLDGVSDCMHNSSADDKSLTWLWPLAIILESSAEPKEAEQVLCGYCHKPIQIKQIKFADCYGASIYPTEADFCDKTVTYCKNCDYYVHDTQIKCHDRKCQNTECFHRKK